MKIIKEVKGNLIINIIDIINTVLFIVALGLLIFNLFMPWPKLDYPVPDVADARSICEDFLKTYNNLYFDSENVLDNQNKLKGLCAEDLFNKEFDFSEDLIETKQYEISKEVILDSLAIEVTPEGFTAILRGRHLYINDLYTDFTATIKLSQELEVSDYMLYWFN